MTKISIITVVYNGGKTLSDSIKSVTEQCDVSLEYIIIDGASTDDTPEIIKTHRNQIDILVSEPDGGIYDAMNKGLKIATGDIIGFLNADDIYYARDVLHKVVNIFETNPSVEIVYGDLIYVEAQNTMKTVRNWKSKTYYPGFFYDGLVPPHPSFFVRKSVYEKSGIFNTSFKFAADYEIMFRFLKVAGHTAVYLPDILVRMRLGGATNRSVSNIIAGNREIASVWRVHHFPTSISFWIKRTARKILQYFPN